VSQHTISLTTVEELLKNIAQLIRESFNYLHVGIGLVEQDVVVSKAEIGAFEETYRGIRIPIGHGIWEGCVEWTIFAIQQGGGY